MKNVNRFMCLIVCCLASGIYAQNAPISIAGTVVSLETAATVPVYALNFNDISSCNLRLVYDPEVVTATGVTIGAGMVGMINTNLTVPGVINLGWYTSGGINLADSSVIFNIQFSRVTDGMSTISWVDNGSSCEYNDGSFNPLNDTPVSDYYFNGSLVFQSSDAPLTTVPAIAATPGTVISVPVTVTDFQMIGSFWLNLQYDQTALVYSSFSNISGYPGLTVDNSQPGIIRAWGQVPAGDTAKTLEDNSILFSLNFNYLGGFAELSWYDDGASCRYMGSLPASPLLNDTPQVSYYFNGSVSALALPLAAGPIAGPSVVCSGASAVAFSTEIIDYATGYVWSLPDGAVIVSGQNTNAIQVSFSTNPQTGYITVYGTNEYGNGLQSSLEVSVIDQPAAAGIVTGLTEVCQGQDEVIYSVDPIANTTSYNWLLPEDALITSANTTNIITVRYENSAVSGSISVSGSNSCGVGASSLPLQVTVKSQPAIINQPESPATVIAGAGTANFALLASGNGLIFHWQEFVTSWKDLTESNLYQGVYTDTLRIINPMLEMDGYRYRCRVSGECEPAIYTDGTAGLSVVMPVGVGEDSPLITISAFPNPFSDFINLSICLPENGELTLALFNQPGQTIVSQYECCVNRGTRSVRINTSGLRPGIYLLSLKLKTKHKVILKTLKLLCGH